MPAAPSEPPNRKKPPEKPPETGPIRNQARTQGLPALNEPMASEPDLTPWAGVKPQLFEASESGWCVCTSAFSLSSSTWV